MVSLNKEAKTINVSVIGHVSMKLDQGGVERDIQARIVTMDIKKTVTFDNSTDIATSTAHGMINGDFLQLIEEGTLPTNLAEHTKYFVISATTDTFQISDTLGGAALDFGSDGTPPNLFVKGNFQSKSGISDLIPLVTGKRITLSFANLDTDVDIIPTDASIVINKA